jgi:hypothetical protein
MVNVDELMTHSKIAIIIAIIYIFINVYYKTASIIVIFLVSLVCVSLFYGVKNITKKMAEIISFSLLISIIFSVLLNKNYSEGFKSGKAKKKKVKEEEEEEEIKPKKKKKNKEKKKVSFTEEDDDTDGFVGDNRLDLGTSFLEAYKNLDKDQIETMAGDTRDLIETQKTLMSTLETLAPVVKEGKSIIDTFKGYFDPTDKD